MRDREQLRWRLTPAAFLPGHPEGYLEAFAQLYADMAEQISARIDGRPADPASLLVPTIDDGVAGMRFVSAVIESSRQNAAWTPLPA